MADRSGRKIRQEMDRDRQQMQRERVATEQKNQRERDQAQRKLIRALRARLGGGFSSRSQQSAQNAPATQSTLG